MNTFVESLVKALDTGYEVTFSLLPRSSLIKIRVSDFSDLGKVRRVERLLDSAMFPAHADMNLEKCVAELEHHLSKGQV